MNAIVEALELENVTAEHKRSEELKLKFDFVLARAVTQMEKLIPLCSKLISSKHINSIPNGLIALKGGNIDKEMEPFGKNFDFEKIPIFRFFEEAYFEEKYIVYVQI